GPEHWRHESWPTVRLGLFTSLIGFAALVFTGFRGLAQRACFSIAGLVAAAATTRFVFPTLVPEGAPGAGFRVRLAAAMRAVAAALPRWPAAGALLALASLAVVALAPSPWRGELAALSPVTPAE